ncbi:MAG: DUF2157 domain-containing protein, partial [Armatimonadota bacterium]
MRADQLETARAYVGRARAHGKSEAEIEDALRRAGWPEATIHRLCRSVDEASSATPPPPPSEPGVAFVRSEIRRWVGEGLLGEDDAERLLAQYEAKPRPARAEAPDIEDHWPRIRIPLSASMVLLYIGGLLMVIAAIMLLGRLWDDLGQGGHFAMVLIPAVALYAAGARLYLSESDRRVAGLVMLCFACILVPAVLMLGAVWILGDDTATAPATGAFVALIALGIQVATLHLFPSPLLTIPYPPT